MIKRLTAGLLLSLVSVYAKDESCEADFSCTFYEETNFGKNSLTKCITKSAKLEESLPVEF